MWSSNVYCLETKSEVFSLAIYIHTYIEVIAELSKVTDSNSLLVFDRLFLKDSYLSLLFNDFGKVFQRMAERNLKVVLAMLEFCLGSTCMLFVMLRCDCFIATKFAIESGH